jgi:ABC-type nickel/cobalt efflux system permease component RcnA
MSNGTLIGLLGLGLILGLRHALDPDHIAAVTTIVSESRSFRRSSLIGTFWGLGHTMSLLIAGVLVIALKVQISDRVTLWMEFAVALMLILLGLKAMLKPLRGWRIHVHQHAHGGSSHHHLHLHHPSEQYTHQHRHLMRAGARPFLVGMVHGLAGSAALMILVLATIPSAVAGLIYVGVFGFGSVGGMLIMSSLISLPFVFAKKYFKVLGEVMQLTVGLSSVAFGLIMAWQIGFQRI